jgi:hypothetical protein
MPAELVTIFSDSERRRRVRFSSGVTAPVGVSNVIMRNPQVRSGHPLAPSQCDDVRLPIPRALIDTLRAEPLHTPESWDSAISPLHLDSDAPKSHSSSGSSDGPRVRLLLAIALAIARAGDGTPHGSGTVCLEGGRD